MSKPVLICNDLWWPFGAQLLHIKWAYIYALYNNYDFFYKYNKFPVFPNGSIEYYYKEIKNVDENDLENREKIYYNPNGIDHNLNVRGHYFPNEYKDTNEFHSDILKKIYCPNEYTQSTINRNVLVQYLKNNQIRYIAVHLRLGDKVDGDCKETNFIPLQKYMETCIEIKEKYCLNTIVICSDTSDGLEEFLKINNGEFEILFNDEKRCKNTWQDSLVHRVNKGYSDKDELEIEYLNCFVNYEFLLNSEIIVGNWDSGFCLVPVEIRNNKKDVNICDNIPLWGIRM